jgi:hypothetical protein
VVGVVSENAARITAGGTEREDAGRERQPAARVESSAAPTAADDVNELGMAALIGLLAQQRRSLDQAELTLSALVETYRNTRADHSAHGLVEVVIGAEAVRRRFELVQYSARHEVLAMSQADYEVSAPGESTAEAQAIRRGVEYRVVIERLMLDQPGTLEALRTDLSRGQQCRVVDRVPSRLLIVDGNIAMLPLSDTAAHVVSGGGDGDEEDEDEYASEREHGREREGAGGGVARGTGGGLGGEHAQEAHAGERDADAAHASDAESIGSTESTESTEANGSPHGSNRAYPAAAQRHGVDQHSVDQHGVHQHGVQQQQDQHGQHSHSVGPEKRVEPAALLVRAPAVIRVVTGLFESVWERAVPIRAAGSEPILDEAASEPTALDLHILSQLMAGATDAAIAKQLGLGLRTVQRRVAHLMELASVTTRLQLGWAAARRGWLD